MSPQTKLVIESAAGLVGFVCLGLFVTARNLPVLGRYCFLALAFLALCYGALGYANERYHDSLRRLQGFNSGGVALRNSRSLPDGVVNTFNAPISPSNGSSDCGLLCLYAAIQSKWARKQELVLVPRQSQTVL